MKFSKLRSYVMRGPDWLFWCIVSLWVLAGIIGGPQGTVVLMGCAFFVKANRRRIRLAVGQLTVKASRGGMARSLSDLATEVMFWTLFSLGPVMLLLTVLYDLKVSTASQFSALIALIAVMILLLYAHLRFARRRRENFKWVRSVIERWACIRTSR